MHHPIDWTFVVCIMYLFHIIHADEVQESGVYVKHENHKCSGSGGTFPTDTVLNGDETTNYQNCKDLCDSEPDCVGFV